MQSNLAQPETHVVIRDATEADIPAIYTLILELAEYEEALDRVENSEEGLRADGFGEQPMFHCFVAEEGSTVIGIALCYFRYSTWKGRYLYLEDLIVTKHRRGAGLGRLLLKRCIEYARSKGCRLLTWQVLDWNSSAIEFYKSLGAELQPEWVNCVLVSENFDQQ
ncbi:MAG: GNAT family N-acetyltransferase [Spirochaetaceae bacterium]|nr:MAG: GNAT family N-acetyltransferase [Spirochaetaceae bacterium]